MNVDTWGTIKELIAETLELPAAERAAFLDGCDLSPETRQEIDSLIAFEAEAQDMMELPAVDFSADFVTDDVYDMTGETVGPYRIIRELGQGGMGSVYLAERTDGRFEQRVALKLLKREMNTSALRRHFEQEREILASLEHPNIARLLDAGTSDARVPYIAMEYVDGLPIGEYCAANGLDLNGRLDLFRRVCRAVDYAHQNAIVHRDLKPSNVLVTADGTPKLLDFGISKILSDGFEQADSATITRLGVMTPSYASPEQLQKKSVTTLSDVYSLGVILFEMLSGHRPFEEKEHDVRAIYSAVIDQEPPSPSSVVERAIHTAPTEAEPFDKNSGATKPERTRQTGSTALPLSSGSLRGDLDNIVLKAMRKEPERRYSSAGNLSEDIRRHMLGLTVTARPNTFGYRASKFIGRNRLGVVAAGLLLVAVLGGVVATVVEGRVAQAERARAERRFNDVRKLANANLFDVYPEVENLEGSLKAREAILKNTLEYLDSLSQEVGDDHELQAELATAYEKVGDVQGALNNSNLGNVQAGVDSYGKAKTLREAVLAANPQDLGAKEKLANNYYVMARTLWTNSQTAEATAMFESGIKVRRELVAEQPDSVQAKDRLAVMLIDYGAIPVFNYQADKALVLYNEAEAIIKRLREADPDNPAFKKSLTRLIRTQSQAKLQTGDKAGAVADLTFAVSLSKELAATYPDDFRVQRSVWLTNDILCEVYIDSLDAQMVVDACRNTIDFPTNALKKEPENGVVAYDLAISHFNLGRAFRIAGDPQKGIVSSQKAIEVMSSLSKKEPNDNEYKRNLAVYENEVARCQLKLNQLDKAIAGFDHVIAMMIQVAAADPETTTYRYDIGAAYRLLAEAKFKKGDNTGAVADIDKAIAIAQELKDKNSLRSIDNNLIEDMQQEKTKYQG